jgi:tRNA-splicing endonuclease subunit Sen34
MSESFDSIAEPIPISLIAGRFLLFDVDVVTYLRRTHHICGVFTGSIPQMPQQNIFMGLPLELMPEEARLLVRKEVAYIVDDSAWHKERFNTFEGSEKKQYLDSLRSEGLKVRRHAEGTARKKSEKALSRLAAARRTELSSADSTNEPSVRAGTPDINTSDLLFNDEPPTSPASTHTSASPSDTPWAITRTTTYSPSSLPQNPTQQPDPTVPSSYPLFAHLHSRDYYLMPGLRFGCDYNVYPGDPLRFHSHFSAVSYDWDEEISMVDLTGGGRLGTRVKKGFLIGGEDVNGKSEDGDNVRTFCIEWSGM